MKTGKLHIQDIILFEDDDYFIANKPPLLSTLEERHEPVNLLQLAREYHPSSQVCHRLDKDTSGILIVAKNPDAYRHMSIQFEKRQVTKVYHAIVDGIHNVKDVTVDEPILKLDDGVVRISRQEGKPAQTVFSSIRSYKMHTLMECRPITGRMHQIRIHLTRLQAPITGDETYGGKPFFLSSVKRGFNLKKLTEEQPVSKRMALHAYALTFRDLKEKEHTVVAPYPKDFQALVRQMEQNIR